MVVWYRVQKLSQSSVGGKCLKFQPWRVYLQLWSEFYGQLEVESRQNSQIANSNLGHNLRNDMKDALVSKFLALQGELLKEKGRLESRLAEINRALDITPPPPRSRGFGPSRGRGQNTITLRDLVPQVTAKAPLTKDEILEAVQKEGYQFTTKNPMATLNALLYSNKNRFKNENGRFSSLGSKPILKSQRNKKSRKARNAQN